MELGVGDEGINEILAMSLAVGLLKCMRRLSNESLEHSCIYLDEVKLA